MYFRSKHNSNTQGIKDFVRVSGCSKVCFVFQGTYKEFVRNNECSN